jgi:hypothetical protein
LKIMGAELNSVLVERIISPSLIEVKNELLGTVTNYKGNS